MHVKQIGGHGHGRWLTRKYWAYWVRGKLERELRVHTRPIGERHVYLATVGKGHVRVINRLVDDRPLCHKTISFATENLQIMLISRYILAGFLIVLNEFFVTLL